MRQFIGHREFRAALAHVAAGGQALFLQPWGGSSRMRCFDGVPWIGKLLDGDRDRLVSTARRLGVRVVRVDREGEEGQHVDLVGRPLARAKAKIRKEGKGDHGSHSMR